MDADTFYRLVRTRHVLPLRLWRGLRTGLLPPPSFSHLARWSPIKPMWRSKPTTFNAPVSAQSFQDGYQPVTTCFSEQLPVSNPIDTPSPSLNDTNTRPYPQQPALPLPSTLLIHIIIFDMNLAVTEVVSNKT